MDMEFDNIYSENPEQDLWQELLRYSYERNIKQYFEEHDLNGNPDTIDCIAGSVLQAHEYYRMACSANLQIAPLLLYYGTTNLLYGMTNLISGNTYKIENHGMNITIPKDMNFIDDTGIKFFSPEKGGVHVFARSMEYSFNLFNSGEWILKEFLDSIAEINDGYENYENFMVSLVNQGVILYNDHGFLPWSQSTRLGGRVLWDLLFLHKCLMTVYRSS